MNTANPLFSDSWSQVHGLRMYARIANTRNATPVVLVHGLSMSSRYMMPTAQLLARDFAVYVPDLPGFGRSAKPPQALPLPALSDHLYTWMQTCGLDRACFVGNSFGCQVIADLAVRYPEAVERAVLTGPSGDPTRNSVLKQALYTAIDAILSEPFSLLPIALHDYLAAGPRRTLHTLHYLLDDITEEKLPRLTAPTLVVRGGQDRIVSHAWAAQAARLVPHGQLQTLPGASHAVNFSAAPALAQLIRTFITEASTSLSP